MAGRINRANLVTIVSAAILVGTEILGAALAFGWAMSSLFQLDKLADQVLIALCLLAGAYGIWRFVLGALKVEPIRE
jgi:hypothetical protein